MGSSVLKVLRSWLLLSGLTGLVACAPASPKQSEVLRGLNIDAPEYSRMSACQQVRLYTDFGAHFLDIDHMVALTPAWMNEALAAQPRAQIADCIAEEGTYRLLLLAGGLESMDDVSLHVDALTYKANELKLLGDPRIQSFLEGAVCKNRLRHDPGLVLIFYYGKFTKSPPYIGQPDDIDRMRAELCT